jgi:DNA-binding transcriptional LysR family regulator
MSNQNYFYYKKSRLQQFKGFCYTKQFGSIIKASEYMGLSPTAVSLQIKSLEEDLNLKLFNRSTNHRLTPTRDGEKLYKKLVPIIQNADGVIEEFLNENNLEKQNTLNIAGHHIVLTNILPKYLAKIKNHPDFKDTKFKLFNIPKEEAYQKTISGEIDIMIYPIEPSENVPVELNIYKIFKYKPVFVLYKGHFLEKKMDKKITIEDLQKTNFILIDKFGVKGIMSHFVEDNNIGYNDIMFKNGNWNMLKSLVSQKLGICVFSKYFINKYDLKYDNIVIKDASHIVRDIRFSFLIKKGISIKDGLKFLIENLKANID